MGALDKLETISVMGVLAGAAFLIYSNWDKITAFFQNPFGEILPSSCPSGYYENAIGTCCPNGTIFENGICKQTDIPPIELPKDSHGCLIGTQHWCETDSQCRDIAQGCTPGESPGVCYEWSPTLGQWLYSPTMPGCQDSIHCSNPAMPYYCEVDGTCRGSAAACPTEPYIPPVVTPSGDMSVREIYRSKIARGFEPSVDDCNYIHQQDDAFYHELKQEGRCWGIDFVPYKGQCPNGEWVDLSSGISLEEACLGSGWSSCPPKEDACGRMAPGRGSMTYLSDSACNSMGFTILRPDLGACWNPAHQRYLECLGDCAPDYYKGI